MDNASLISNVLLKFDSLIKQKLLNLLKEKGVETPENWEYLKLEDLTPPLKLIEARKLIAARKLVKKKNYRKVQSSSIYFS